MNRVIIVGNGFDLTHGLETKYEHFINWYWGRWLKLLYSSTSQFEKDELFEITCSSGCLSGYFYTGSTEQNVFKHIETILDREKKKGVIEFKLSDLLFRISKSIESKGWVDVENDYYELLVENVNEKDKIRKLNRDLTVVQHLLTEYLGAVQSQNINISIVKNDLRKKMLAPFSKNEIAESASMHWTKFIYNRGDINSTGAMFHFFSDYGISNYSKEEIEKLLKKEQPAILSNCQFSDEAGRNFLLPNRVMLLNFNYTNTADLYLPQNDRFVVNHIHGELTNPDSIVFGYGDETDDEHQVILKKKDNEYLRHFKTYRYLETPNYRQLLSFIESEPFQVCIIGHSCGLSDRTMLKTIFEHKNCVSIKPYYYINESGRDNYLDIVQNISRNFTDMSKMRDRVVNKTYCSSL